jgi:hypothetical protein
MSPAEADTMAGRPPDLRGRGSMARRGRTSDGSGRGFAALRSGEDSEELDGLPALDEVCDGARQDNQNDRERQQPGPPAVSCEQHVDLRGWG